MRQIQLSIMTLVAFTVGGSPSEAQQPVTFDYTRIAGPTKDQHHPTSVAIDGNVIAFVDQGVYIDVGGNIQVVANVGTPVPGGRGVFYRFENLSLGGSTVAFAGWDSEDERAGIYTNLGGVLSVVANGATPVPNGTGNFFFSSFYAPGTSTDGSHVVFSGSGLNGEEGVYLWDGFSLSVVADKNTPVPGDGRTFGRFGGGAVDDGNVVFPGGLEVAPFDWRSGIYLYEGTSGNVSVVADADTPIPGGTGNFVRLGGAAIDNGVVVFSGGRSSAAEGIYTNLGGSLSVIADTNSPVPGASTTFTALHGPSISGNHVAFYGCDKPPPTLGCVPGGIYATIGGSLTKVIDTGDRIHGRVVTSINPDFWSQDSLSGDSVVFIPEFAFGRAMYRADPAEPECPTSLALADHAGGADIQRKLYRLRDEILDQSETGKYFTQLFYRHAEEIRSLMERDPGLRTQTGNTLAALAPRIAVVLDGGMAHLSEYELRQIHGLMDAYAARASSRLRLSLWWLRYGIQYRTYLSRFGFRIGG